MGGGRLSYERRRPPDTFCWECEAQTAEPVVVTLRTATQCVGTLTLCPACYRSCYLPLAPDGHRTPLLVGPAGMGERGSSDTPDSR